MQLFYADQGSRTYNNQLTPNANALAFQSPRSNLIGTTFLGKLYCSDFDVKQKWKKSQFKRFKTISMMPLSVMLLWAC